jgi:hypothetical protein
MRGAYGPPRSDLRSGGGAVRAVDQCVALIPGFEPGALRPGLVPGGGRARRGDGPESLLRARRSRRALVRRGEHAGFSGLAGRLHVVLHRREHRRGPADAGYGVCGLGGQPPALPQFGRGGRPGLGDRRGARPAGLPPLLGDGVGPAALGRDIALRLERRPVGPAVSVWLGVVAGSGGTSRFLEPVDISGTFALFVVVVQAKSRRSGCRRRGVGAIFLRGPGAPVCRPL